MRRIITENGPDGRSRLLQVAEVPPMGVIWESDAERPLGFEPRRSEQLDCLAGGLKAIHLELPTDAVMADYLRQGIPGLDERGFHRTGTLDYVILLEGELTLELDDGSVRLEPGDIVVQRDTNHAWRNTGDRPTRCLAIIHKPLGGVGQA